MRTCAYAREKIEIEIVESSIQFTGRGLVNGIIFFSFGSFQFPESKWNDSIVVVLGWWLRALFGLAEGATKECRLRFMEGPYEISIQRSTGDHCEICCLEGRDDREMYTCQASTLDLLISLYRTASRVQSICHQKGWESADIKELESGISSVGPLVHEH